MCSGGETQCPVSAHRDDVLRDYPDSIARVFTNAGYTAEWFGKEHWGTTNHGLGFGSRNNAARKDSKRIAKDYYAFDKSVGRKPENAQFVPWNIAHAKDEIFTDHAIQWLDEYDGSEPFFLGLSLSLPHFPFITRWKYYKMYRFRIDLPRVTEQMLQELTPHSKLQREKYNFADLTDAQIKKARGIYYGMVTYVDEELGRLINKLDEKGLRNSTIIVYVSDHGEMAGEHGLWYKNNFFEDSVKVPMILSYPPKVPVNKKFWFPVQVFDIVPTLYDLCEIPIPPNLDAKNFMPVIRGEEPVKKRIAISETYTKKGGRMIRERKWKYCWYGDNFHQLFDMIKDQAEENNLYNDTQYAVLIQDLHQKALDGYIPKMW